jgi:hypothetical protein
LPQIKESSIELLNDATSEYTMGAKLHFQIRLKKKDYRDVEHLHTNAQAIPEYVW